MRTMAPVFALLILVATGAPLAAATWTGAALSDRWSDAGNWAEGSVPGAADEVVFAVATHRPSIADVPAVRSVVISARGVHLGGGAVTVERIDVRGGSATVDLPLRVAALRVAAEAQLEIRGPLTIAGDRLVLEVAGELRLNAAVDGDGAVEVSGQGQVTLSGRSTWRGGLRVRQATLRLAANAPADGAGALGRGEVRLSEATLVLASDLVARPITIGLGGVTVRADGRARTLSAPLAFAAGEAAGGGSLVGTYLSGSRRALLADDWRSAATMPGVQRNDSTIFFPNSAFGTQAERQRWHIAGNHGDWDDFAVQWDGWIRITTPGTCLYTASDDGSRVWIDRDGAGAIQAGEWGDNGWGRGQATTLAMVSSPLKPGFYRIRVQYEEGEGGNAMALLWDDATCSAGEFAGQHVVPAKALERLDLVVLAEGPPITLTGAVSGVGTLQVCGPQATLAVPWPGQVDLLAGSLACAAAGVLDRAQVMVAVDARLSCARFDQRPISLSGGGTVALDGATLGLGTAEESALSTRLLGPGRLHKRGEALLRCLTAIDPTIELVIDAGQVALVDGRLLAVLALRAPLTTRLELPHALAGSRMLHARVTVPAGLPALGIGAFAADRHGHWYQRVLPQPLAPGTHEVSFAIARDQPLIAEPSALAWDASAASICDRSGLFVWAAAPGGVLRIEARLAPAPPPARAAVVRLSDLRAPATARTGERWELACRPQPFPANPYDPALFALDAVVTAADGSERRLPGFYTEPMRSADRGDGETVVPSGAGAFQVRWRPGAPGRYRVRLEARWGDGRVVRSELPPVEVSGARWDGYVRVDPGDPRFFTVDGAFYWPIGLNIRSVTDSRCAGALGTDPTPLRGTLAYDAYLERFAAAGGDAVEIWLAAWNLGLEWRADWDGFHGVGRYHLANAWRLDRVLDAAWARGVRVNLVISNHGQGSDSTDREWEHSPYNRINGGRLDGPSELFHDAWALAGQERLRRYLVARYADHPAVLGWKLWSEINLTDAHDQAAAWHRQAAARWRALDTYGHPCTTHWAGDWGSVEPEVAQIADLGYLCIDAYHGSETSIADLLWRSTQGLQHYGKPVLVTEYGGGSGGASPTQMEAEHASGAWAALVSGHAGAPMLWWWEWVDQGERWGPYRAIAGFIRGEDLRQTKAGCRTFTASGSRGLMWCRAWSRPGRMLGYVSDPLWLRSGVDSGAISHARITLGEVGAGGMSVEWWDADRGSLLARHAIVHPGGPLVLTPPTFSRHLGWKLIRQ